MAERIFTVFEGTSHPDFPADEGDVKYHQGAEGTARPRPAKRSDPAFASIRAISRPSIRSSRAWPAARQDQLRNGEGKTREERTTRVLPVLLHGDAAFAGQGIVMETLQLANLPGIAPAARSTSSSTIRSDLRPRPSLAALDLFDRRRRRSRRRRSFTSTATTPRRRIASSRSHWIIGTSLTRMSCSTSSVFVGSDITRATSRATRSR